MEKNHKHRWNDKHSRKDRDNHHNSGNWNDSRSKTIFRPQIVPETSEDIAKKEAAIKELKSKSLICPVCSQPIHELASCMTDKNTGSPVHFDCVLNKLQETEKLGLNEKITYIGGGKFAVLYFENIHDTKHFQIRKTIEWENQETKRDWRDEMSNLYSQVK